MCFIVTCKEQKQNKKQKQKANSCKRKSKTLFSVNKTYCDIQFSKKKKIKHDRIKKVTFHKMKYLDETSTAVYIDNLTRF